MLKPKNPFPAAKPEELSVSSEAIAQTIRNIREDHGLEMHSFLLLRKGKLVWEEYFRENEPERLHVLHSVSKSFTSLAVGIAQAQGLLSIEDKLYDFFPEYASLCDSDRKRQVTLRHLLMMGSGFENKEEEIFAGGFEYDMVQKALALPVIHPPGKIFNYYTLGTYLLSAVFSRICPMGIHAYLRQKLMDPMGFGPSHWNVDLNDVPLGGFGLYLQARDLARAGQFLLQNGVWESQQLAPAGYIRDASAKQIENNADADGKTADDNTDWGAGYGFQFWRNSFGGFRADGMHGQYIVVLPEKEVVLVMTSRLDDMQIPLRAVADILLPGIE